MPHKDKKYRYEPLSFYPHLGPKDAHIWDMFVHQFPKFFTWAIYDMRCGEVVDPDPTLPDNVKSAWRDLCRGRIDVVAGDNTRIFVIEVKPHARGEAIGQALNNAHLFKLEHPPREKVIPTVITDLILPPTKLVAEAHNVLLLSP